MWRRIHVVPFTETIPLKKVDKTLPAALAAEASGILNWAIEGFKAWQNGGLRPPKEVTDATEAYKDESDPLGEFFDIWGVRLSPSCMGAYCNDAENRLQVFVDGEEVTGNIRDVALEDQRVIAVTYGNQKELPDPIPSEFDFSSIAP